jgi:hypothetical protein
MNEPHDDPDLLPLQAFIDRIALESCDRQRPPEPEPPKVIVQPESRIVVAGRGIRSAA